MKTVKKICAGFFLIFALLIFSLFIVDLTSTNTTQEDKEGALAAIAVFGFPSAAIGTWLVWGLRQQHQKELKQLDLEQERKFLHLLQQQQGEITVTQFALATEMSLEEAEEYLNHKAEQLNADFAAKDDGGIVYKFPY